ncbi:MAG: MFS transporter [Acidobacteriota bacterium]|nr:MFS transporter [Acidobacteriota bacterium]
MESSRRNPPVWVMGLSNSTLGFMTGIAFFVLPQLMADEHVPEAKIAVMTALAISPNFWAVAFSPMLDVRFSRRWYATFWAALAGISTTVAFLSLHHLMVLQLAMVAGVATTALSAAALGGWLSNIIPAQDRNALSKWMNIGLVSGTGVVSLLGGELFRHLPVLLAATLMGAIILLPATAFVVIPAPGPDRRLAGESFGQFNREVLTLLRRREVVIVLLLFLSPCSSFVLPNLLGGLGADFHASARAVSLSGGVGAFIPGIVGSFAFTLIARRVKLRFFYLANGVVGSFFTLSLLVLPHDARTFALALVGEYLFQAVAFSIQIGIVLEAIGPGNPLAATTFAFLTAATNVPVTYVAMADGHAYAGAGITGTLVTDAMIGITTCLLAGILLAKFDSQASRNSKQAPMEALPEEN